MAATAGYFDRKPTATNRPGLSHLQASPSSPHTPQRTFSSAFSSPSLSYRAEEEIVVFELGARHLSAGIAGESNPRCRLGFGPESGRRVGDYRQYYPEYQQRPRKRRRNYSWGEDHELWRMDLRDVDLGLVEDKVERAVREAYTRFLLLDSKNKRLVLVLPSLMPHRLLSSVLSSIFSNFSTPSITLFSSYVLNVTAAGCRSGLVVDVGWGETVICGVYEYREVQTRRTTKAMKRVTQRMAALLKEYATRDKLGRHSQNELGDDDELDSDQSLPDSRYFDIAEEVTSRIAWCQVQMQKSSQQTTSGSKDTQVSEKAPNPEDAPSKPSDTPNQDTTISIPSPLPPHKNLQIPFSKLAEPVEDTLLATRPNPHHLHDDHEQPLHTLIYHTLLSLPPDVRSQCISRIIITGGGSHIPGLKTRLLNEVKALVDQRGWDPVSGEVAAKARKHLQESRESRRANAQSQPKDGVVETHLRPQVEDEITEKLNRMKGSGGNGVVAAKGEIRGLETLGAWAGGSLVAGLKVKGVVEVDRDSFLTSGLAGAKREAEVVQTTQRMSLGARSALGEKGGWTLGTWA